MKIQIVCDSYHPYFTDICQYLNKCGADIKYDFIDGYRHSDSLPLFNSHGKHSGDYIHISFCKARNASYDFLAMKNILILNDRLDYNYSDYKDVISKFDKILVNNNYFRKILSKINQIKNSTEILDYYYSNRVVLKSVDRFVFKITSNINDRGWRLFLSAYARAFEDYDNIDVVIDTRCDREAFQFEISQLFVLNNLSLTAFDHIKLVDSYTDNFYEGLDCYVVYGQSSIDRRTYDCMGNNVPILCLDNKFYNDYIRSNTAYCVSKMEDSSSIIKLIVSDSDRRTEILGRSKTVASNIFSKDNFFKTLKEHIGIGDNFVNDNILMPYYSDGMENIVI